MNEKDYAAAIAERDALNEENQKIRVQLEELGTEAAECQGRIAAVQAERESVVAEFDERLKSLVADLKAYNSKAELLAARRKEVKHRYGILHEDVGLHERAAKRKAEGETAKAE